MYREVRKKLSEALKGKIISEETRKKISEAKKGRLSWNKGKTHSEETRKKMSEAKKGKPSGNKGKTHSEETKKKMSKAHKGQLPWNKGKTHSEKTKKKLRLSLKDYQEKYSFFCQVEELRETKVGEIQGHCKNHNCKNSKEEGGWFTLTAKQILDRKNNLENKDGNDGSYFYCSQECKDICPIYNLKGDPLKETNPLPYTSEEYQTFRTTVLERDKYICQFCGKPATIVHHIKPQKLEPFFALDIDYAISVCRDCHYKKGHPSGTPHSTGKLANVICKPESQNFLNQELENV